MIAIPINPADRATLIAEIDSLAAKLAERFDELPEDVQASMIQLGHGLSGLRDKLNTPYRKPYTTIKTNDHRRG